MQLEEERRLEEEYDIKLREERHEEEEVARERSREERSKQRNLIKAEREHKAFEQVIGQNILRNSDEENNEENALHVYYKVRRLTKNWYLRSYNQGVRSTQKQLEIEFSEN